MMPFASAGVSPESEPPLTGPIIPPIDSGAKPGKTARPRSRWRDQTITLSHGAGGSAMRDLITDLLVPAFAPTLQANPWLRELGDCARFDLASLAQQGDRLAFATDTFVVEPLFFPGGDIGSLAVNGTVNDLAMGGARPLYLSCGFVLEEGLATATLERVVQSMAAAAMAAGVAIVTGDTKVVPRGKADQIFINTTGIGVVPIGALPTMGAIAPGDVVLLNGYLGDHGAAILVARGELAIEAEIASDCQPLADLVAAILAACPETKALRDATRGGLAAVLHEFAQAARLGIRLEETALPVREPVMGLCELLGLEPLHLANEGKLVAIVPADRAEAVLAAMQAVPAGRDSCIIGEVVASPPGTVLLHTIFGADRAVDLPVGELLPRIC